MKTVQISLNSIGKVKSFVNTISQFEYDFDLISGRYVIDAKSIMGIFSLDLSKPIDLAIHTEDNLNEILEALKPYIIPSNYLQNPLSVLQTGDFLFHGNNFPKTDYSASTRIVSVVSIAVCISSSIFSSSRHSDFLICFKLGLVTGCFATKIVQQSSYGRMDVSYVSIFLRLIQYPACPWQ